MQDNQKILGMECPEAYQAQQGPDHNIHRRTIGRSKRKQQIL